MMKLLMLGLLGDSQVDEKLTKGPRKGRRKGTKEEKDHILFHL
jgi:hypothetical protein